MIEHKFPYRWTLKDAVFTKDKGKVFSCFACGGGSTMGYTCQLHLLDASKMGVPQRRERVFFICMRKDLAKGESYPKIDLKFNEREILFNEIDDGFVKRKEITSKSVLKYSSKINKSGTWQSFKKSINAIGNLGFGYNVLPSQVPLTKTSKKDNVIYWNSTHYVTNSELCKIGSFPLDYNFINEDCGYLIGMSVPPIMTAQIATRIYEQWLTPLF